MTASAGPATSGLERQRAVGGVREAIDSLAENERAPTAADVALAGALVAVAVLSGFFFDASRADTVGPASWWHWLVLVTPASLVAFRRTKPLVVPVVAAAAQAVIWISGMPDVILPMFVILFTAAANGGRRGLYVSIGTAGFLTVITSVGVGVADDVTLYQVPLIALTGATAISLGHASARQRRLVAELASDMAAARTRAGYERAEAISNERAHIARELHDIIGHTLATIAVRAEAADRVSGRRPEAATEAVVAIAGAARSALTETRQVLSGLRTSEDGELGPTPDLAAIHLLVDELASAGVDVSIDVQGCERNPPPAIVVSGAFRIVQESLTNAVRHAGVGVSINVKLRCDHGKLQVTVTDDGGSGGGGVAPQSGGFGLAGMAERAEVLGGVFTAEPGLGGGYRVHAVLPSGPDSANGS